MINRRGLITGLISFVAAPAIVRYGSLMPVKAFKLTDYEGGSHLRIDIVYGVKDINGGTWNFVLNCSKMIIDVVPEYYDHT